MTQHDLAEIDLRDGSKRLRLRRGHITPVAVAAPTPILAPMSPVATPPPAAVETTVAPTKSLLEIKSPTPGTFYTSAKPGDPSFVKVGSKVTPETVVCLIEAMKIFNEIQAEVSGVIVEVVVQNQQPVEYGQVLFRVDPAG
jgi:acetyl-CoA carboxylase biotin carboxyl carrier protein